MKKQNLTRREMLKKAAALGLSVSAINIFSGCDEHSRSGLATGQLSEQGAEHNHSRDPRSNRINNRNNNGYGDLGNLVEHYTMPIPRRDHGAVIARNRLYIAGGTNDGEYLTEVLIARIKGNGEIKEFTSTTPLPDGKRFNRLVTNNEFLYAVSTPTKEVFFAEIQPGRDVGEWIPSEHELLTDSGAEFICNGDFLYSMGGQGSGPGPSGYHDDTWFSRINPDGSPGPWNELDSKLNLPRSGMGVAVWNDKLYLVGGNKYGCSCIRNVESADINPDGTLGDFTTLDSTTPPVIMPEATVHNGKLYLVGGFRGSPKDYFKSAQINPNGTLEPFTDLEPLETPVYSHAVARNNWSGWNSDKLFIVGGGIPHVATAFDDIWVRTLE